MGGSIAGLFAGLLRLATKAIFPETDEGKRLESSVYFGIATLVIAVCCFALHAVTKMKQELEVTFFEREYALLVADEEETKEEERQAEVDVVEEFNENEPATETFDKPKKKCHPSAVFVDVTTVYRDALRCAWIPILVQFVNFCVTVSLYPGLSEYLPCTHLYMEEPSDHITYLFSPAYFQQLWK